jgi:hypothetical protein
MAGYTFTKQRARGSAKLRYVEAGDIRENRNAVPSTSRRKSRCLRMNQTTHVVASPWHFGLNVIVFELLAFFLNSDFELSCTTCKKRKAMYVRVSVGFFFRPHVTVRRPLHEL